MNEDTNVRKITQALRAVEALTPDELMFFNLLKGMNESQRTLLVESLQPQAKIKRPRKKREKSAHASSLERQIQTRTSNKPILCSYQIDGKTCLSTENDGIHDETMGYASYHKFQPPQKAVAAGD